jgi:hypothetical protein
MYVRKSRRNMQNMELVDFGFIWQLCLECQPPIEWVPGGPSLGVKRLGPEADHSPPSSAEVKECVELYLHSPSTPSWSGVKLKIKHRDNLTFNFTLFEVCMLRV